MPRATRSTDPLSADTDGDGLPDSDEVQRWGTDPLQPDPDADADGLPDLAEQVLGTDPQEPDTDGDGLIDGDEVYVHATDPLRWD